MTTTAPYSLPPSKETNGLPVNVEDNIVKALAETAGMNMLDKYRWFLYQVKEGGPMDYKNKNIYKTYDNSPAAQDFGNFNYGVVGTALGFPTEILDKAAGYAQILTDLKHFKIPNNPFGSDNGDNPGDQAKIDEGIAWAESNGYVNTTNLTSNAQGTDGDDVLWVGGDFLAILNLLNGVTLNGGGGNDFIVGSKGSDELQGGEGEDILYGLGNDDFMFGNQGDDILHGGKGSDWLEGGEGDDILVGSEIAPTIQFPALQDASDDFSSDTLKGGKGNDFLAGGGGDDTYIYNTGDGFDTLLDTDGLGQINYKAVRRNNHRALRCDWHGSQQAGESPAIAL